MTADARRFRPRRRDDVKAGRNGEALDVLLKELGLPAAWRNELAKANPPHLGTGVTGAQVIKASEVIGRWVERVDRHEEQLQAAVADAMDDRDRATILLRLVLRCVPDGLLRDHAVVAAARAYLDRSGASRLEDEVLTALKPLLASRSGGGQGALEEAATAAVERAVVTYEGVGAGGRDRDLDLPSVP